MRIVGTPQQHRPREVLEAQLAAVEAKIAHDDRRVDDEVLGARDALRWVLGRTSFSPISETLIELPDFHQSMREGLKAEDLQMLRVPCPEAMTPRYAAGVWQELEWAWASRDEAVVAA